MSAWGFAPQLLSPPTPRWKAAQLHDGLICHREAVRRDAGVFQFIGRVGQGREGHAVPCKADAYIQSAAGKRCAVHVGAAAALLRVDRGVLGKVLPDVVAPCPHLAACGAVGGGLAGAKTQVGDLCQLPAQAGRAARTPAASVFSPCHVIVMSQRPAPSMANSMGSVCPPGRV